MQKGKDLTTSVHSIQSLGELVAQVAENVRQLIKVGTSRCEVLTRLATVAEVLAGNGSVASILVIDEDGLLRNGASPNLPADYLSAIDRLKPDANVGTCAAAAATGAQVITPDFQAEALPKTARAKPSGARGF